MSVKSDSSSKNSSETVPMYRSAFNSKFRDSINYEEASQESLDIRLSRQCSHTESTTSSSTEEIKAVEDSNESTKPGKPIKFVEHNGYVGFANFPNQLYLKAIRKGFEFTLMVVGCSGLGKSTFINSLFLSKIYETKQKKRKTLSVEKTTVQLKENGVSLTLTVVDTPGFGDAVDNTGCWEPVLQYIQDRYEDYFEAENKIERTSFPDNRVHCCLYFIQPTGHNLKPLDIEFMKRLCRKVNLVPVIAKGDTLTPEECRTFKKQILRDLKDNHIEIYDFPEACPDEEDDDLNKTLKARVPFAVAAADGVVEVRGKEIRGRRYPWGVVDVENLDHCDFTALRKLLVSMHMDDLKVTTHCVHYENYRVEKLTALYGDCLKHPLLVMEEERKNHRVKLQKAEKDMELMEKNLRMREKELIEAKVRLTMQHEKSKNALEKELEELRERKRMFEKEKKEFNAKEKYVDAKANWRICE